MPVLKPMIVVAGRVPKCLNCGGILWKRATTTVEGETVVARVGEDAAAWARDRMAERTSWRCVWCEAAARGQIAERLTAIALAARAKEEQG